jgi:hypothetical protein
LNKSALNTVGQKKKEKALGSFKNEQACDQLNSHAITLAMKTIINIADINSILNFYT